MERETTKHGPMRDEDLARDVEPLLGGPPVSGRSREERMQEAPDEERLATGRRPDVPDPRPLTDDERAELAASLAPLHYPTGRDEIVRAAADYGIGGARLESLRRLPAHRSFDTLEEIWLALGHERESRTA